MGRAFDRMYSKFANASANYRDFIATLPPERRAPGPIRCPEGIDVLTGDVVVVGTEEKQCSGYVWNWHGPLELDNPAADWKQVYCYCDKGLILEARQGSEESKARNLTRFNETLLKKHSSVTLESFAQTRNGGCEWYSKICGWFRRCRSGGTGIGSGSEFLNLVALGGVGVGKTGLLIGGTRYLIEQHGVTAFFISMERFVEEVWGDEGKILLTRMRSAQVLIIDDLGAGHRDIRENNETSPLGKLFGVLNERWGNQLITLVTSNCEMPEDLERAIGPRNYSRLGENCQFALCRGEDLRKKAGGISWL